MQHLWINIDGKIEEIVLPSHLDEVMPGVQWGAFDDLFTPSFWKYQSEAQARKQRYSSHKLGETLLDELAVCLLGGYGIPAEMGMRAFDRLSNARLLDGEATEAEILAVLSEPFQDGGKARKYRFAKQKASYLSRSLRMAKGVELAASAREIRDQLLNMPGIGPKTASWIVRNHLDSDDVAIIDVHLHRACVMMNVFESASDPTRDYYILEELFLKFAKAIKVRASVLDAVMWDFMRRIGPTARSGKPERRNAQLQLAF
ncbi:hypothetical protein NOJ05_19515 [Neorhizobium galegae]|uniref:8-oxoguanine DNA glycosylase n=1 Tax=Neorhizobium galegae TaxID=399 RepID=UPI002104F06F|nr:hypothetical protein [Neorhizobium galegae]MCQ1779401.1 hypothetical protein [Neorhizobium galegae]MCQ1795561.1 hypothetical protein [Neorhizobium galegae]